MRRRYLVSGRVQGVGFRYYVRSEARRLRVTGWVRNLVDGRVEALAHGTADELEEFERSLRRGPPGASVTDLHATDMADDISSFISFEIAHLGAADA